jgi:hypothetical protein
MAITLCTSMVTRGLPFATGSMGDSQVNNEQLPKETKSNYVRLPVETNLGAMLRCFMAMERWTMRRLALQIGISSSTLCRLCDGKAMDADTLLKVVNWMVRTRV